MRGGGKLNETVMIDDILSRFGPRAGDPHPNHLASLPDILRSIQDRFNYLPLSALRRIVERTDITAAEIESVASFYPGFRTKPAGLHTIQVCVGTACFVKGANQIFDAFRETLRIAGGDDTDPDRLFTLEKVACLGCCMLAPAVRIDDTVYGQSRALLEVFHGLLGCGIEVAGDVIGREHLGHHEDPLKSSYVAASGTDADCWAIIHGFILSRFRPLLT